MTNNNDTPTPVDKKIPPLNASGPVATGLVLIALAFGGFGTWTALAPLNSAAIAPGIVSAETRNKTIQHLEGGIIHEIIVSEGDAVEAGQVLMRLDDTRARTTLERLEGQYLALLASAARLLAERDNKEVLTFPQSLMDRKDDPEVQDILSGQTALFEARRATIEGRISILRRRIAQSQEEVAGLKAQVSAERRRLELLNDEIESLQKLVAKGHASKQRMLALQREAVEVEGNLGEHRAMIARAKQSIGEAELQIIQLGTDRLNEVVSEYRDTQTRIFDLEDRLYAARDTLARLAIKAPRDGVVVGLNYVTSGGVVTPGAAILDIVPKDDRLVVEAKVKPEDIDVVHAGMTAQVMLTAYKQRNTPLVEGKVVSVSADRITEPQTGLAYFLARIHVDADAIAALEAGIELYPGMPAEVLIETGERTAFDYMLSPVTSSLRRSFLEE